MAPTLNLVGLLSMLLAGCCLVAGSAADVLITPELGRVAIEQLAAWAFRGGW